ncbi:MAG: glycosyltransferase family 4 protein [Flavitalea sp.]
MRIGIEIQRIFRKKKHGMEIVGLELMRELQQLDRSNEYVLFAKNDEDKNVLQETENFKIHCFNSITYADWEQIQLPRAIKKFGVDLLHCTCNTGPVFPGVPMVLTLHDIIYLENLNFKGSNYQNFGNLYRRLVVPRIVERSELIITVSEFEKRLIRERLEIPEEKVKVVYNGVHSRFHQQYSEEQLEAFRNKYKLPTGFLLFLGNKAPKKNTVNVIKAFAKYCETDKNHLPLVVLDYEPLQMQQLLNKLRYGSCMQHMYFPGYISPDEMPLMYQCAKLFLYPSLRESFGMPILEAMASGTPVITSNTSSMPEVGGNAALYVDPFSPDDILRGIMSLSNNSRACDELIQEGRKRASLFSWRKAAEQVLSFYDQLKNK